MSGDRIFLEGMVFYGYHGVDAAEKTLGQRFVVDVEIAKDLRAPGRTDSVADTVNYADVYRFAKNVVEGPSRDLLEAVAEEIARRIAEYWPEIEEIRVRVRKPEVSIKGSVLAAAGVEIVRRPRVDYP
ncbi:MAG TPA: dihydroneopterin aldolase [Chloroflexota bacterium]|nr:dihydroneopterin aldolase [Chloroflexota bacterium]